MSLRALLLICAVLFALATLALLHASGGPALGLMS
jgi:hypothetical protein